jgi:hypothetical protein
MKMNEKRESRKIQIRRNKARARPGVDFSIILFMSFIAFGLKMRRKKVNILDLRWNGMACQMDKEMRIVGWTRPS